MGRRPIDGALNDAALAALAPSGPSERCSDLIKRGHVANGTQPVSRLRFVFDRPRSHLTPRHLSGVKEAGAETGRVRVAKARNNGRRLQADGAGSRLVVRFGQCHSPIAGTLLPSTAVPS